MKKHNKTSSLFTRTAQTLLLTIIIFLFLNIIIYVIFNVKDSFKDETLNPITAKYEASSFDKVYPGMTKAEITQILNETWLRPLVYESFTQFKEGAYRGTYVNVDKNGFRISGNQSEWPPTNNNFNIFLFGGSTTFGYGLADNETIPSYLQEVLVLRFADNVKVYNFGRGHYYSSQECMLFQKLIIAGFVPDMAIFIDGINDFSYGMNGPMYTPTLTRFVNEKAGSSEMFYLNNLPWFRFMRYFKDVISGKRTSEFDEVWEDHAVTSADIEPYNDMPWIKGVVENYMKNKKVIEAVSSSFGVQPIFVWQPVPMFKYDIKNHLFAKGGFFKYENYSIFGYPYMDTFVRENDLGDNFLWCADMQENLMEPLYVDKVHYTAGMSEKIAHTLADLLFKRKFLVEKGVQSLP